MDVGKVLVDYTYCIELGLVMIRLGNYYNVILFIFNSVMLSNLAMVWTSCSIPLQDVQEKPI